MKTIPDKYKVEGTSPSYSPVVCFSGEMVITSGQCYDDHEGYDNTSISDIREQTRLTIKACKEKLEAAGSSLDKVVFVEVSLTDMNDWAAFNEVYCSLMPDPKPARKTVQVGLLPDYKIEIVMIATK